MRRLTGMTVLLVVLTGLPACSSLFGGDRSVAYHCEAMFDKYAPNPGDHILRECEAFYTHHASDEQKAQLQCLARVSIEAAKVQCVDRVRTVVLETGPDETCPTRMVMVPVEPQSDSNIFDALREGANRSGFGSAANALTASVVQLGEPEILGELGRTRIVDVVKTHTSAIEDCYTTERAKHPTLRGQTTVKFVIAQDGSVSTAATKTSTLESAAVNNCVARQFKGMKFPKPKGGGVVIVRYPMVFAPTP